MKKPEQICPDEKPGYRKWLKALANRLLRRASKRDPENAPKKAPKRGYSI